MKPKTDDLRIANVRPLVPPGILLEEIPASAAALNCVLHARKEIAEIVHGSSKKVLAVVGPCSIHDVDAALEYARGLRQISLEVKDNVLVVMRAYFEKPRTNVGWKGFINDPDIDETFNINKGLRLARQLLVDVNTLGLPTGSEFLDTQLPQHISDVTSWVAIGARTTESQVHRELASGLSMPVGFKNTTEGSVQPAVDAVIAARSRHWFPSVTKQAVAAIFQTRGNPDCHIILRGGSRTGPNFDEASVRKACAKLEHANLPPYVMVDCSHGNSGKDATKQAAVIEEICRQRKAGFKGVMGVMLESNLRTGRQEYIPGRPAEYGVSITDACIDLAEARALLLLLAKAL